MKGAMQYALTALLEHAAAAAGCVLLFAAAAPHVNSGSLSAGHLWFYPLLILLAAALAFALGALLRRDTNRLHRSRCWNAAMIYYVLNLAIYLFAVKSSTFGAYGDMQPSGPLSLAAQFWCLPELWTAGTSAAHGGSVWYLLAGALLAAVEPLCLTLGLLLPHRPSPAAQMRETVNETLSNKENTPHA